MKSQARKIEPAELDSLKRAHNLSTIFTRYGFKPSGSRGSQWVCCPWHSERSASCHIDDNKGRFHCFGCGVNGDHLDALSHLGGKSFWEAVEDLGGINPLTEEDRRVWQQRQREAEDRDRKARAKKRSDAERLFDAGRPIEQTVVWTYLKSRGLIPSARWTFDLRFAPAVLYRGFADVAANDQTDLGEFPAMLAAIRDVNGNLIGCHRTYLQHDGSGKLAPPGDTKRNKSKKVLGEVSGGMIRLSEIRPVMAVGEGIETSRSYFCLGLGGPDIGIASAVSLGNLSGSCLGSLPHPTNPKRTIPDGNPDPDRPGLILPPEVREVILLGDGDSDPEMTRMRLLAAARRFKAEDRRVFISMAPPAKDFNNVLNEDSNV